jgi:hypothetical protein
MVMNIPLMSDLALAFHRDMVMNIPLMSDLVDGYEHPLDV